MQKNNREMKYHYLEKILTARVYDVAIETPLDVATKLSERFGNKILLKREDLQPVFSFKLRGAYNKLFQLCREGKPPRVIAASAGNHAQGVALAATRLGIKSVIVMPETTPLIKVDAVRRFGGIARLHGDTYDEANELAQRIAFEEDIPFIHPYDDPDVIAGQGTIAAELLRQFQDDVHAIFVPVGGGGLIAGIAAYIKAVKPRIRIIGVEPVDAASMKAALETRRRVKLDQVGIFADGVAVRQVGKEPFRLAQQFVDEVVVVEADEICAAIKDIFDDTRSIAEPAGALAVAAIKNYVQAHKLCQQNLIAIIGGANMNFDRLRHVSERSEIGERREMLLGIKIPEKPGSFRRLCITLGKRSITEFNYRYANGEMAHVLAGVELNKGQDERSILLALLRKKGYEVTDLTDNEMAKLHIRYMIGGHICDQESEWLLRFEFPERPGALMNFLTHIHEDWNISLFHYRNHGAAYGRVLIGIQFPKNQKVELRKSLNKLGYPYWDETENPAYALFLR